MDDDTRFIVIYNMQTQGNKRSKRTRGEMGQLMDRRRRSSVLEEPFPSKQNQHWQH
jgi:hypothetical protein